MVDVSIYTNPLSRVTMFEGPRLELSGLTELIGAAAESFSKLDSDMLKNAII